MSGMCETRVTIESITEQINKKLGTNAKITSYETTQIGIMQGFLSKVVRIHDILWDDGNPKLPKSVVAKIPQMDNLMKLLDEMKDTEDMQKAMVDGDLNRKTTRCEGAMYELFSSFDDISPKLIKCYGSVMPAFDAKDDKADDPAPFLVLEDMSGTSTGEIMKGINEQQFGELADVIADVQAWSIINREKWIDNKDMEWDLTRFFDDKQMEKSYADFRTALKENEMMKRTWNAEFGDGLEKALDDFKLSDSDLVFNFDKHTTRMYFPDVEIPSVLLHGDCHPFNMMFEGNTMKALIDWQACRAGNPFVGFIRLMTVSPVDTARLEWWPKVFERWHARLSEKLGSKHALAMAKEDLWKLYEISFYYNAALGAIGAVQFAQMKDGMIKGFNSDVHIPAYMGVFCRMMRDGLEIKKRYSLK